MVQLKSTIKKSKVFHFERNTLRGFVSAFEERRIWRSMHEL